MPKINQQSHGYSYTTAPSCRTNPEGKMLPIQLEIPDTTAREMILANLDGNAPQNQRFRSQLPLILAGQPCDWILWNVRINPQRLALSFADQSDDALAAKTSTASCHERSREAILLVRRPESLRCTLIIPPIGDEPEIKVHCHYYLTKSPGASGQQKQTLWICESRNGKVQFCNRLRTPVLPVSPQEEGRID